MKTLCKNAEVEYFKFHALRNSGASVTEADNAPIGSMQGILGPENRITTEIDLIGTEESEKQVMAIHEQARKGMFIQILT